MGVKGIMVTSSISFIKSLNLEDSIEDKRRSEQKQQVPDSLVDCNPKIHN